MTISKSAIAVLLALLASPVARASVPAEQTQAKPAQVQQAPPAASSPSVGQASRLPEQQADAKRPPAAKPAEQTPAKPAQGQQAPKNNQKPPAAKPATAKPGAAVAPPAAPVPQAPPPPGYVIGPEDVLMVFYWREKDLSAEVTVRPDGMISLPLLNDLQVSGLTPDQLRDKVTEAAKRFVEDPSVTIVVKQINSRKVFITGEVAKPGPYALTSPTTVLQLIAMAGGLSEFAKKGDITIMRTENGKPVSYPFNYKDVTKRKNLKQNIELKPGDTVIVP